MASVLQIAPPHAIRRIQRVQTVTIAWMSVEAVVSLFAALRARSPALPRLRRRQRSRTSLGARSAVEISCRCRTRGRGKAGCPCRGSLVVRTGCVCRDHFSRESAGPREPKPTFLGIAVLVAAATIMPWLAKEKRRLSGATGSAALRADAAQSALCVYLSLIALAGLAINAIWHVKWADPIAALAVLPLIVWEGREAMRGKACGCG